MARPSRKSRLMRACWKVTWICRRSRGAIWKMRLIKKEEASNGRSESVRIRVRLWRQIILIRKISIDCRAAPRNWESSGKSSRSGQSHFVQALVARLSTSAPVRFIHQIWTWQTWTIIIRICQFLEIPAKITKPNSPWWTIWIKTAYTRTLEQTNCLKGNCKRPCSSQLKICLDMCISSLQMTNLHLLKLLGTRSRFSQMRSKRKLSTRTSRPSIQAKICCRLLAKRMGHCWNRDTRPCRACWKVQKV